MKKRSLLILTVFGSLFLKAQVSEGGYPYSFRAEELIAGAEQYRLPGFNLDSIMADDAFEATLQDIPYRFGYPIPVSLNLKNAGTWQTLSNGDRLWRLELYSQGAKTLNINYDEFDIPSGAKFFVYTPQRTDILGAFTRKNVRADHLFATSLTKGDRVILEYYEPGRVHGQGKVGISSVVHGYRGFDVNGFGSSGSCNINIKCPEGSGFEKEIRATCMILKSSNSRLCTGALINNVRNDGKPFFLTANHCGASGVDIVMFNYESPQCSPSKDGPTNMTVLVDKVLASNSYSDFVLALLQEIPPSSYNSYYAGWSIDETPSDSVVTVHHPSADIKKISFSYPNVSETGYLDQTADKNHWKVSKWDKGTTEHYSSGSPLFDKYHRVIGQLHGGYASCSQTTQSDWFGKFSISWNYDVDTTKQLQYWLDPDFSGLTYIDGMDYYATAVKNIQPSNDHCTLSPNPSSSRKVIISGMKTTSPKAEISIVNLLGEEVLHALVNANGSGQLAIDLADKKPGVYFVMIGNEGQTPYDVLKLLLE